MCVGVLAARSARSFASNDALQKARGRRESRVPSAPAIVRKEMHTGDRKVRRNTRPSLRNGFTAYGALSPEPNSFGLRR
jgi:hypothetical protein